MKLRTSRNPCALCGGYTWHCYEQVYGGLVPGNDDWEPIVDYYDTVWSYVSAYSRPFVDECQTCGAVVS